MSLSTEIVEATEEEDDHENALRVSKTLNGNADKAHDHIASGVVEIAVAVGDGASSVDAVKWVLQNNLVFPGGLLHLLHVQAPLRFIPSPMGHKLPLESVSEDVANRHKLQRFLETEQLLYKYKKMCDDQQVNTEVCYSEGDIVYKGLIGQISSLPVAKLVLGKSSQSRFTKALKRPSISSLVAKHAPEFCSILVVCNGKLRHVKEAVDKPQR